MELVRLLRQAPAPPAQERRPQSGQSIRLGRMPVCGERSLPSAKEWSTWYDDKFRSWAGAQHPQFASAMDAFVRDGSRAHLVGFEVENGLLAYEICSQTDDKMAKLLVHLDKTDGAVLLRTLKREITRGSAERTAGLHSRFSETPPCKTKESLLHALAAWKEDLEELAAAGATPSRETVMTSLKSLVSGVRELKSAVEIVALLAPGDTRRLYSVAATKAAEWSVFDSDARMSTTRQHQQVLAVATDGREVCKFFL